jgi:sulfate transport system substrate-binding protein
MINIEDNRSGEAVAMNRCFSGRIGGAALACAAALLGSASGCHKASDAEILNVSYDPTRELYEDLNKHFAEKYQRETGKVVKVKQSHGGSSSQARKVIDGLEADVVTLALWSDVDAIRQKGLIKDGWEDRLPEHSLPYFSTIVFVVRKGNPKGVKDWPDLVKEGVQVITPDPKTSGNGRLSFLAAWGSVIDAGGSEEKAEEYVGRLYEHVPVLDEGARGATATFAQKHIGDVHLTWENEAHLEVGEAKGELEVVYPPASIRAEPYVAVVDAFADRHGTRAVAEAYLKSLYDEDAQEIIAKHYYRPIDAAVLAKHQADLPALKLFTITTIAKDWGETQKKFFDDQGVYDRIKKK